VINSNLGRISHRLRYSHLALNILFKIAAKPLQINTWLLLTAYKKSPPSYPLVPSPTLYDLPFPHLWHDWLTIVRYYPSRSSKVND